MESRLEQRLIARAQKGDMAAFAQLYRAFKDPLFHRVIRPKVRTRADAEDVLVDTFATALQRLDQFRWVGHSLFAWLARIATNKAHDLGRRAGRDEQRRQAWAQQPADGPTPPDEVMAQMADRERAKAQVAAVLAGLNPRYAEALSLRMLEGRSRAECAAQLGVKVATFDVVLLRATRSFRKAFAARYEPTEAGAAGEGGGHE